MMALGDLAIIRPHDLARIMRIVALDIGTKRIGVAATDPLGIIAQPICVIERKGDKATFQNIVSKLKELKPDLLVIGIPLDEESEEGKEAKIIRRYSEKLERHLKDSGIDCPVEFWDERYSTAVATERLLEFDVTRKKRRAVIDMMAALVILEDYLESKGN